MSRKDQTTTEGSVLVTELATADAEYRNAVLTLEKRIREAVEEELTAMKIRRDIIAFKASQAGVPKSRIARDGLHTSDRAAAYKAIANGEKYAGGTAAPEVEETPTFRLVDGVVVFAPSPEDVAPILERLELEPGFLPADASAEFTVSDGIIAPVTPPLLPSGTMNPLVAMVMADGSKHARAMVEFVEGAA